MNVGEHLLFTRGLNSYQRRATAAHKQLARGVYVKYEYYQKLSHEDKYLLRSVALGMEGRPLLGKSAAALWQMLTRVHNHELVHIIGTGRPRPGIWRTRLDKHDLRTTTVCGFEISLTSPALTVIDIARWHGLAEAVRCGDFALANNLTTEDELLYALEQRAKATGIITARTAVRLINHLSESPRESDVKVNLFLNGFEPPYQQAVIRDSEGVEFARVDFFYPEKSIVIEYDGQAKTKGHDGIKAVNNERTRERRLISEGLLPIRVDNNSWQRKLYLKELERYWNDDRKPFPSIQWSAPGRAWEL